MIVLNPLESGHAFEQYHGHMNSYSKSSRLNPLESGHAFEQLYLDNRTKINQSLNPLESGHAFEL